MMCPPQKLIVKTERSSPYFEPKNPNAPTANSNHPMMNSVPPTGTGRTKNLRFQGMGTDGTESHGQGCQKTTQENEEGGHCFTPFAREFSPS